MPPAVLLFGGSGFLGQYVIEELTRDGAYNVLVVCNDGNNAYLPSETSSSSSASIVKCVPGNLATGEGFLEAFVEADELGRLGGGGGGGDGNNADPKGSGLAAVVNCAAVSSPAECQRDPEASRAVNVPTRLVAAMLAFEATNAFPSLVPSPEGRRRPPPPQAPLLVHLSTDQIYSGRREALDSEDEELEEELFADAEAEPDPRTGERPLKSLWSEREAEKKEEGGNNNNNRYLGERRDILDPHAPAVRPLNAYAKQKVEAELFVTKNYPRSVCLRSSVMYGKLPRNKKAVRGMRFLQFCDEALKRSSAAAAAAAAARAAAREAASGSNEEEEEEEEEEEVTSASFFDDEFRSFVAVTDVAKAVAACVRRWGRIVGDDEPPTPLPPCAINVGGPERLSRASFARLVAAARGLDQSLVKAVPSASVDRAVPSPRDISMRVGRLEELLGVKPLPVAEALRDMPPEEEEEEE